MSRLLLLFCVLLAGCAGYRSGEVSRAYVEMPPPAEAIARGTPNWLQVPGARLRVELRNEVQRREHQVVLFIVPVMIDPRDRPLYSQDQGPACCWRSAPPRPRTSARSTRCCGSTARRTGPAGCSDSRCSIRAGSR
ncbi:hypothetical protein I0E51_01290 [Pseudomonas lalucatii]|nr:hypothetical protein [Pseudomonas lalucatii]MBS7724057.1 hypothetical protein [Pseudomonas lalucatii]